MKDAIITKTIPNIHKNILLFFITVFFFVFLTFIALLEGFGIDRLTFGGVKIEKLYLKWENALLIKASKIDLDDIKSDNKPFTLNALGRLPRFVRWSERWVESVDINTIQYKNISASLIYRKNTPGTFTLYYDSTACKGDFTLNETSFHLTLPSCPINGGEVSGNLTLNLPGQLLRSDITLTLPETPALRLRASGDVGTLRFTVQADREFTTIEPLIRFLGVGPKIAPWIVEYAKASSLHLDRIGGKFAYDEPNQLLNTLYASATVENAQYTFAQGFEPIRAPRVDLRFEKGKLHILPRNGTFYALPTEKSRLWIDFAAPDTMLQAFIQTRRGQLNDPILNLLHHYRIDLPIKQTAGECAVDLNLSINLHTLQTTAQGTFVPTASELLLDRIALRSEGGIVRLDTQNVRFENFTAHYGNDLAHARVSGEYDASVKRGRAFIEAYDVSPLENKKQLSLFDPRTPLRVTYNISSEGDTLNVMPSVWNLFGEKLNIGGFNAPFDYRNTIVAVQSLPFRVSEHVQGKISARFNGTREQSDIGLQLERFHLGDIILVQAPFRLDVRYSDNQVKIQSPDPSAWSVHKLPLLVSPLEAGLKEDEITFEHIEMVLADLLKGSFSGHYRLGDQAGSLLVKDILPISPKITPMVDTRESVELIIAAKNDQIRLDAPALKAHFSTIPEGWKIALDDISLLSRKSPLLRRYHIDKGYVNLFYTGERSLYSFNGAIDYPYPLMLINDRPLSQYRFGGSYRDGLSTIRVNDRLVINHTPERIYVRANNAGINMPELFKFLSARQNNTDTAESDSDSLPIRIHATNSYLHLMKGRKILADTLDATLNHDDFDATLSHIGGTAVLKIRNGLFYIDGEGFNDTFMKHLFSPGDLSGGTFSFQAEGKSDAFEGLMRVENTIFKDYVVLNNVLAFINTIPSLTTFSLPNYHSKGLPVQEGYAHFAYSNGIVNVDNFTLNSPEMKILGEGHADMNAHTLDGRMTLKTDLGSALGKVPMVGYILFGEDGSIATTLTLSGKLDDPKVETAIAKEIVTAPFNILKRTVIYPFLWMIPDEKKK